MDAAADHLPPTVDSRSGYCAKTATFYSLRQPIPLPPPAQPMSITSFCFSSVLCSSSNAGDFPFHPAYIFATTGASVAYPALFARVRSLATALQPLFSKGDVAFVLSPTSLDVPILYMALFSIGAVVCPSNPACTPAEISRQLRLVKPKAAFATRSTARLLQSDGGGGLISKIILLDTPEFRSHQRYDEVDHHDDSYIQFDLVDVQQSDPALALFSSGTTGMPKAVLATHLNIISALAAVTDNRRRGLFPSAGPCLLTAPMFHVMGLFSAIMVVALRETAILMDRPGLHDLLTAASKYHAVCITAAPPVVVAMASLPVDKKQCPDLSALRQVLCGGAPLHIAAAERFRRRFPWVYIQQGYAMSEATMISVMATPEECINYKSVGRLTSSLVSRIVDIDNGKPLGTGMLGELRMKSPYIMKGYMGDDEATISIFDSEGWMKTGDLCYFDDVGYLYIAGRIKELIKYKGYQVAPVELEQLLISHEEIVDAAVIPYPDDLAGELPMAFVVRRQGSTITGQQVMDFVAKQVAPYKKIRKVAFINSIPRNPAGKILKKELTSLAISRKASL